MWFLYGELFVLLFLSFVVGCVVAGVVLRVALRRGDSAPAGSGS